MRIGVTMHAKHNRLTVLHIATLNKPIRSDVGGHVEGHHDGQRRAEGALTHVLQSVAPGDMAPQDVHA